MEIKLLNYSVFITESQLKRISCERFELIKQTTKAKCEDNLTRDMNSSQSNRTYLKKYKRTFTNQSYISKKNSAHDIIIRFCEGMNNEDKNLYSSLITSEMGIQNTEMFIDVLSMVLKNASIKSIMYIIKNIERIKNKIISNEILDDKDIVFNQSLTNLINALINKYYQDVDEEIIINKLTTTYVFEKEILVKKLK